MMHHILIYFKKKKKKKKGNRTKTIFTFIYARTFKTFKII